MWTEKCQDAFRELRTLLINSPLLIFPDFAKPFVLETDASGAGLGAVLAQKQKDGSIRPVAYASRSLQPHERNYGITELEGLGMVWAVKHFRLYLYGHTCEVFTDHSALTSLLNTPQPSGKLARWGMAIQVAGGLPYPRPNCCHCCKSLGAGDCKSPWSALTSTVRSWTNIFVQFAPRSAITPGLQESEHIRLPPANGWTP